ncbi:MAG: putative rane protein [Patescibacteria group bacterium]|jgi:putative membrane protein|nr:putative rane protein [Patescibacteria group bacterium]
MKLLIRLLINALAILLIAYLVPGVAVTGFYTALIVAVVLGLLNLVIKPLILLLTLPITIITLGLFTFVINALLFWFVGTVVKGFSVEGFIPAFIGALILTVVGWIGHSITSND